MGEICSGPKKVNKKENLSTYSSINLLKSAKSYYIIKEIFSFLDEKKKLNMIIYNKKYQKRLDINIDNYKILSGILHVGGRNGYGTETLLDTHILIYRGGYINNKRHGKGKEFYNDGKLKFEGDFFNGYKIKVKGYNKEGKKILNIGVNGKGKEYYNNGKLKFKGEYLYGKRWNGKGYNINGDIEYVMRNGSGYVKEYDYNGELIYEGIYYNGEENGEGKEYIDFNLNFLKYKGEYLNGKRNGKGKEYNIFGILTFEGDYLIGKNKKEKSIIMMDY